MVNLSESRVWIIKRMVVSIIAKCSMQAVYIVSEKNCSRGVKIGYYNSQVHPLLI